MVNVHEKHLQIKTDHSGGTMISPIPNTNIQADFLPFPKVPLFSHQMSPAVDPHEVP